MGRGEANVPDRVRRRQHSYRCHTAREFAVSVRPPDALGTARWMAAGWLVQITVNSLTGDWGRKARDAALWLLQRQLVRVVASDAHDTEKRPPILSAAREYLTNKMGQDVATALVESNPLTVVENGPASSLLWAPKL